MSSSTPVDVLVLAASNGENLKLAERFADEARKLGSSAEVLDLTLLDLPLYRPKAEKNEARFHRFQEHLNEN